MRKYRFTIAVATHNRPLLLQRALSSLVAQTFQDFFVIIVDDAASFLPPYPELKKLDGRYAYLMAPSLQGPGESRDAAVKLAPSDYVMFLDDDDSYQPDHLQNIAQCIHGQSEKIYFTNFTVVNEERQTHSWPKTIAEQKMSVATVKKEDIYVRNRIPNCCLIYPLQCLQGLMHDYTMTVYEDWDYLLQCLEKFELAHVDTDTVNIHKCKPINDSNQRRGNRGSHLALEATLRVHASYPSPSAAVTQARAALFNIN
jgi:glycosyltransferase involved in cell wall biosynthesis